MFSEVEMSRLRASLFARHDSRAITPNLSRGPESGSAGARTNCTGKSSSRPGPFDCASKTLRSRWPQSCHPERNEVQSRDLEGARRTPTGNRKTAIPDKVGVLRRRRAVRSHRGRRTAM